MPLLQVGNIFKSELFRPGGSKEAWVVKRKISQAEEKRQVQKKVLSRAGCNIFENCTNNVEFVSAFENL